MIQSLCQLLDKDNHSLVQFVSWSVTTDLDTDGSLHWPADLIH